MIAPMNSEALGFTLHYFSIKESYIIAGWCNGNTAGSYPARFRFES